MAASTVTRPATRTGGLALMAAVILMLFSAVFHPGGWLVGEPVDQTDFAETLRVMGDYASLAHLVTMLGIVGMLLYSYSFITLWRVPQQSGLVGSSLRLGILSSLFGWGLYIIAMGMRHMTIHLMQRSMEAGADQALFQALALNIYAAMAGIVLALVAVYPVSSILIGIGVASRLGSMDITKLASYGLALMGAAAGINFLILQHVPDIGPETLLLNNNYLLFFGSFCLFIIGLAMYRGRSELSSED
ncbi:MAG: hypothetical protein F4Y96_02465 [Chloroflexi bacterium]|nr:hypothetical protein [Chloroflexota bacterium]